MKRWALALIVLLLAASLPAGVLGDSSGMIAYEEGVVAEVVKSSCSIVQSGDYYLVYCYAQVHNPSDQILCINEGTFELYSDNQLLATQEVSQLWPYFLNPGEDGYLFDIVAFEPNEDGVFIPNVTGIDYFVDYMPVNAQFAGTSLDCTPSITYDPISGNLFVICELSNPTQEAAYSPTVAFGLYMDNGALIYAGGTTLQGVGVPAGGTTLMRFAIDDAIVTQWSNYGVSPTQVQAKAMFRTDAD